jgi:hypothetical protein
MLKYDIAGQYGNTISKVNMLKYDIAGQYVLSPIQINQTNEAFL